MWGSSTGTGTGTDLSILVCYAVLIGHSAWRNIPIGLNCFQASLESTYSPTSITLQDITCSCLCSLDAWHLNSAPIISTPSSWAKSRAFRLRLEKPAILVDNFQDFPHSFLEMPGYSFKSGHDNFFPYILQLTKENSYNSIGYRLG